MFKVTIVRGDKCQDYEFFKKKCIECLKNKAKSGEGIMINTTGDEFVEKFSARYRIDMRYFFTDWKKYGKDALKARNIDMLDQSDAVIAFDASTKDLQMITKMATEKGLPLRNIK